MNFRASAKFTPRDLVAAQSLIVPRVVAAITAGCSAVVSEAQIVAAPHIRSGDYYDSIHTGSVALVGTVVSGEVVADSEHAAYVEFGTGIRGAESPLAGEGPYSESWPGMVAQAPLRVGLDSARPAIRDAFAAEGFEV